MKSGRLHLLKGTMPDSSVASNSAPRFHSEVRVPLNEVRKDNFSLMRDTCIRLRMHNLMVTKKLETSILQWKGKNEG